jgi:hypothetical protein
MFASCPSPLILVDLITLIIILRITGVVGLCPLSGILETRKHNVSETDPVSESLFFLVSRIQDDGQSPKTQ